MHVTLNQLKEWQACTDGYKKVLESVGVNFDKDAPINLSSILKSNDIDDTFWCVDNMTLTPDQERDFRLLACGYAERVLPIFEKEHPDDKRPRECIEVAKRFAVGEATQEERDATGAAAWDAAGAAARAATGAAAGAAAWAAAGAAAWDAAGAAARAATGAAAGAAAWDAAGAAARAAAWDAARDAARAAEKKTQEEMLMELLLRNE